MNKCPKLHNTPKKSVGHSIPIKSRFIIFTSKVTFGQNPDPSFDFVFFPDNMILNFFRIKFLEKLSNGLIDIHLIVPPN